LTTKNPAVSKSCASSKVSRLALLAGAAALAPLTAHADSIVYTNAPANATGDANGSNGDQIYNVDLVAGDSNSEFTFTATHQELYGKVYVTPGPTGTYLAASGSSAGADPSPLTSGSVIGPGSGSFVSGNGTLTKSGVEFNDYNWPSDGTYAYLGVSFQDSNPAAGTSPNGTYYGWIDVSAPAPDDTTFTISGWAYCSSGGTINAGQTSGSCGSVTPEPTSLGLLALGGLGIAAVRARRKKVPA